MAIKMEILQNIWIIGKPRADLRCHDFSLLHPEGRTNVFQQILKMRGFKREEIKTSFHFFLMGKSNIFNCSIRWHLKLSKMHSPNPLEEEEGESVCRHMCLLNHPARYFFNWKHKITCKTPLKGSHPGHQWCLCSFSLVTSGLCFWTTFSRSTIDPVIFLPSLSSWLHGKNDSSVDGIPAGTLQHLCLFNKLMACSFHFFQHKRIWKGLMVPSSTIIIKILPVFS